MSTTIPTLDCPWKGCETSKLVIRPKGSLLGAVFGRPATSLPAFGRQFRDSGRLAEILQIRYYLGLTFLSAGHQEDGQNQLEQARRMSRATGNMLFARDIDRKLGGSRH